MKTIVVQLYGGPSSSKSTTAEGLDYNLKIRGYKTQLLTEYAKDVVWKNNLNTLTNQIYVYAKQHDKLFHLKGKVEVVVTDSPTLMCIAYTDSSKVSALLEPLIVDEYKRDDVVSINVFLDRVLPYDQAGRYQTEAEADEKAREILALLLKYEIPFYKMDGNETAIQKILDLVMECKKQIDESN